MEENFFLRFGSMSRLGKIPIEVKTGVNVEKKDNEITVSGAKGNLSWKVPVGIEVSIKDNKIVVSQKKKDEKTKALFGLTRMTIANMIKGVDTGYEKKLELSGVGFRAQISGEDLVLSLGFSHPVVFKKIDGIKFGVTEGVITISGANKALVGDIAAKVRAARPPEPYKGKGIKYLGEKVRRKAGKAAKAVGGTK